MGLIKFSNIAGDKNLLNSDMLVYKGTLGYFVLRLASLYICALNIGWFFLKALFLGIKE